MKFVFVGERRSRRAIAMNVTWADGHLAARTLHTALAAAGLDPADQVFLNLFRDEPTGFVLADEALARVRALAAGGATVVGLGRRVQAALARHGVPHTPLVHPAARGRIRARAVYQRHVADALGLLPVARRVIERKESAP